MIVIKQVSLTLAFFKKYTKIKHGCLILNDHYMWRQMSALIYRPLEMDNNIP